MSRTPHYILGKNKPLTPYQLPLIIWDIVETHWSDRDVEFTENSPRSDVERPTIVWKIYRKVPGKDGVETLKARVRTSTKTEDGLNIVEQSAQWMTIIYQFDIFHTSNQEVNILTEEFEDLLFSSTPTIKKLGASEFIFDEQLEDREVGGFEKQDIYKRTLRYRCILERKFIRVAPTIQQIWISPATQSKLVSNESIVRSPNSNKDRISNTWVTTVRYAAVIQQINLEDVGTYLQGVDFNIVKPSLYDGRSYIEWVSGMAHPSPNETYYISYVHDHVMPNVAVKKQI